VSNTHIIIKRINCHDEKKSSQVFIVVLFLRELTWSYFVWGLQVSSSRQRGTSSVRFIRRCNPIPSAVLTTFPLTSVGSGFHFAGSYQFRKAEGLARDLHFSQTHWSISVLTSAVLTCGPLFFPATCALI